MNASADSSRRPIVLLAVGASAGLVLALSGLLHTGSTDGFAAGAIAQVNGIPIRGESYERLVSGLESDLRRAARDDERARVLDRMIDEELLVQRGLELGLARHDRRVRADLVTAVISSVTAEVGERSPDPEELEAFFSENRDFFTQPGRARVRQVFFRVPAATDEAAVRERASRAVDRLRAGEPLERVRAELGDDEMPPVPDARLPLAKLREYLGPTALRSALELEPGGVSDPVRSGTGVHVLVLAERESSRTPELETIRDQVRSEWIRRAGDRALREYLDELRSRADVRTREMAP